MVFSFKKDMDRRLFPSLDFACIKGYPQSYLLGFIDNMPMYDGDMSQTYHHICQFLAHISNYGEVPEDVLMKWFCKTLDANANIWFRSLLKGSI
jgi:hypothetical protein